MLSRFALQSARCASHDLLISFTMKRSAVLLLLALATLATGSKILMQGLPFATSHHMVLAKIGRELVQRGHEVLADLDCHHRSVCWR